MNVLQRILHQGHYICVKTFSDGKWTGKGLTHNQLIDKIREYHDNHTGLS